MIQTCISFLASSAAKTIAKYTREKLAPFGVTPIQFAVLQAIFERSESTSRDIGEALMIDSATIVGVLDRLEKLDLVRRERSTEDRRVYLLHLGEAGTILLPQLQQAMDELNEEMDAALGDSAETVRGSLSEISRVNL
ncbi:MarR family transcriptional regulator [Pseudovibrio exalbescens]|uniref:MarR family winged helix-turn-helix transcriptional regulator n=1 Tax=Pseudovibrio exalbescens TaxID=197461 RepID=UPI002365DA17|nr:MarR family transcriptional regulator [Pseudovibrio exalbescens]MDD7908326.1 MarR family transcriptional regulator [Pseudovibrio exalbescens]